MKFTFGCDPEIFIGVRKGDKVVPRSAYGLIPGTKKSPHVVPNGAVQIDGMALEFNTDPVGNKKDWVKNINSVMASLREMVPEKYEFIVEPSVRFNGNHFRIQPEEAKELGCDPDFNAWTGESNPRPDAKGTLRTASGHIHIGFCEGADVKSEEHMERCSTLVRHLDYYLGLPSLWWDRDTKRRSLYGKAGAMRLKPYGVEYRVLSNVWLKDDRHKELVFDLANLAVKDLLAGKRPADEFKNYTVDAINSSYDYYARIALGKASGIHKIMSDYGYNLNTAPFNPWAALEVA